MSDLKVHVHQYKSGALRAEVRDGENIVKEIWYDMVFSPKVTLHLLKKHVEIDVWLDSLPDKAGLISDSPYDSNLGDSNAKPIQESN